MNHCKTNKYEYKSEYKNKILPNKNAYIIKIHPMWQP